MRGPVPDGGTDEAGADQGAPAPDRGTPAGGLWPDSAPTPTPTPTPASPAVMLEVGNVVKPHGLRGDVIVSLVTNREERVAPGSVLTTVDGRSLTVLRSSPHRGRFIVAFEGFVGIDDAEALRGALLLAPPLDDPDALWVHDLIGARVEDTRGRVLGTVEGVEANPASDLLVLEGGGLIPLRFVVGSRPGDHVMVEIPDGLLDLP